MTAAQALRDGGLAGANPKNIGAATMTVAVVQREQRACPLTAMLASQTGELHGPQPRKRGVVIGKAVDVLILRLVNPSTASNSAWLCGAWTNKLGAVTITG
jgi:hypothetical protein